MRDVQPPRVRGKRGLPRTERTLSQRFPSVFLVHFRNPLNDAGEHPYAAGDVQDERRIDQIFREFQHDNLLAGLQDFGGVDARGGDAALHHLMDDEQRQAVEADTDKVGGDAEGLAEHLVAPQEEAQAARDDGWSARVYLYPTLEQSHCRPKLL